MNAVSPGAMRKSLGCPSCWFVDDKRRPPPGATARAPARASFERGSVGARDGVGYRSRSRRFDVRPLARRGHVGIAEIRREVLEDEAVGEVGEPLARVLHAPRVEPFAPRDAEVGGSELLPPRV